MGRLVLLHLPSAAA